MNVFLIYNLQILIVAAEIRINFWFLNIFDKYYSNVREYSKSIFLQCFDLSQQILSDSKYENTIPLVDFNY